MPFLAVAFAGRARCGLGCVTLAARARPGLEALAARARPGLEPVAAAAAAAVLAMVGKGGGRVALRARTAAVGGRLAVSF